MSKQPRSGKYIRNMWPRMYCLSGINQDTSKIVKGVELCVCLLFFTQSTKNISVYFTWTTIQQRRFGIRRMKIKIVMIWKTCLLRSLLEEELYSAQAYRSDTWNICLNYLCRNIDEQVKRHFKNSLIIHDYKTKEIHD